MKIKELIKILSNFNQDLEIHYRGYYINDDGFIDLPINDVRLSSDYEKIVLATQGGVE